MFEITQIRQRAQQQQNKAVQVQEIHLHLSHLQAIDIYF